MEKYITIKTAFGNFMISCNDIKGIEQLSTTKVKMIYGNGKNIELDHTAVGAAVVTPRTLVSDAVEAALATDWRSVTRVVDCSFVAVTGAQAEWTAVSQN